MVIVTAIQSLGNQAGSAGSGAWDRDRPCKRKTKEQDIKRVVEFAKGKYRGFNDRHLTEKLAEKLEISRETVRQILAAAGIASPPKEARKQASKSAGETGG